MKIDEKVLEFLSSNEYALFEADVLNEAGNIHASTNQMYDAEVGLPYRYHLDLAVNIARSNLVFIQGISPDLCRLLIFSTAFHDVLEDTRETYNDLLRLSESYLSDDWSRRQAVEAVYAVTNEKGRNRHERANEAYYAGIRNTAFAPYIKVCDRVANMTFAFRKGGKHMRDAYLAELDNFIQSVIPEGCEWPYSVPEQLLKQLVSYGSR